MFNWLGTWLGDWFGSGDPAPPYTKLKLGQQIFVCTELAKHYAISVSHQIIAFAEKHEVSVLTAMASRMTVCIEPRTTASSPARAQQPTTIMAQRAALSVVVPRENRVSVRANNPRALYVTENAHDSITVLLPANAAFVLQKPSPDVVVTTRAKTTAATGGV